MKKIAFCVMALGAAVAALFAICGCNAELEEQTVVAYSVTYIRGSESATGTAPEEMKYAEWATVVLPSNPYVLEGYAFVGWNDGNATYSAGDSYTMPAHDVVFSAQWQELKVPCTVIFSGGEKNVTGSAPELVANVGDEIVLPENTFFYAHHTFAGWSYQSELYEAGERVVLEEESAEFCATWSANDVKILFDGGEGVTGEMSPALAKYGEKGGFLLPDCSFKKEKHRFIGWSLTPTGEILSGEAVPLNEETVSKYDELTLYAVWVELYSVRYLQSDDEAERAQITGDAPQIFYAAEGDTVVIGENPFSYEHHHFIGWRLWRFEPFSLEYYLEKEFAVAGESYAMPNGELVISALWEINYATIIFDGNSARGEKDNVLRPWQYDGILKLTDEEWANPYLAPEKMRFAGWSLTPDGTPVEEPLYWLDLPFTPEETLTFYAVWELVPSEVTLDAIYGTWTNEDGDDVIIGGTVEEPIFLYRGQARMGLRVFKEGVFAATTDYSYHLGFTFISGKLVVSGTAFGENVRDVFPFRSATEDAPFAAFDGKWQGSGYHMYFGGGMMYFRYSLSAQGVETHCYPAFIQGRYVVVRLSQTEDDAIILKRQGEMLVGYLFEKGKLTRIELGAAHDEFFVLSLKGEVLQLVKANEVPAVMPIAPEVAGMKFVSWIDSQTGEPFDLSLPMHGDVALKPMYIPVGTDGEVMYVGNYTAVGGKCFVVFTLDLQRLVVRYMLSDGSYYESYLNGEGDNFYSSTLIGGIVYYISLGETELVLCGQDRLPLDGGTFHRA